MNKTKWFIRQSKTYTDGMNPNVFRWLRAYVKFMWLSRNDRFQG